MRAAAALADDPGEERAPRWEVGLADGTVRRELSQLSSVGAVEQDNIGAGGRGNLGKWRVIRSDNGANRSKPFSTQEQFTERMPVRMPYVDDREVLPF